MNEGLGKDFYRKGRQFGVELRPFTEPPDSENWKAAVLGRFRFRFLKNGSGGSGSAFGFGKNGSDGSSFRFVYEREDLKELILNYLAKITVPKSVAN